MQKLQTYFGVGISTLIIAAITVGMLPAPAAAVAPGDNGRIAYTASGQSLDIFSSNADGSDVINLTNTPGNDLYPEWSPDGTKIIYVSNNSFVTVMNADGTNKTVLPLTGLISSQPTWSPDGSQIAFLGSPAVGAELWQIYVANSDGSNATAITSMEGSPSGVGNPKWSPDGDSIVFNFFKGGTGPGAGSSDVYTVNPDGTNVVNLTQAIPNLRSEVNHLPAWSPDGEKISYIRQKRIWVMDKDGSNNTQLTFGSTTDSTFEAEMAWSPDGTKLVIVSNPIPTSFNQFVYIINSDGSNKTQVPIGTAYYPDWQTIPNETDTVAPTITASQSPMPNAAGWNKSAVTVAFNCADDVAIASCTGPITVNANTAVSGQVVTGTATDTSGNTASTSVVVKLDTTAPTVSSPSVTPRVIFFAGNINIAADASDALSGAVGGEYYIDTDPGVGNGTAMTYNATSGEISATKNIPFGSLSFGVHRVYIRTVDAAGNWSTTVSRVIVYI